MTSDAGGRQTSCPPINGSYVSSNSAQRAAQAPHRWCAGRTVRAAHRDQLFVAAQQRGVQQSRRVVAGAQRARAGPQHAHRRRHRQVRPGGAGGQLSKTQVEPDTSRSQAIKVDLWHHRQQMFTFWDPRGKVYPSQPSRAPVPPHPSNVPPYATSRVMWLKNASVAHMRL